MKGIEPPTRAGQLRSLVELVTRPSGWRRIRLFGASARAPRRRRRADAIALVVELAVLLALVPTARSTGAVEQAIYQGIGDLPGIVDPFASFAYDLLAAWAALALVLVVVRGRWRLLGSSLVAIVAAIGLVIGINQLIGVDSVSDGLALGAPLDSVPVQFVVALAVASVVGREMSRPFREAARRIELAAVAGAVLLPVASPSVLLCAVLVAMAAVAATRVVVGSPIASTSAADARDGLADLGVTAEPDPGWAAGVTEATDADGRRLQIEALGRDDWDAQLTVSLWRFLWYRNSGGNVRVTPRQRIEHQAYLQLIAAARGAPVCPVVTAGVSRTGDALLATELVGRRLDEVDPADIDDGLIDAIWGALFALHAAGVSHGDLRAEVLRVDDGRVVVGSFDQAESITRAGQVHADRAQLLVATALLVGADRAVRAAVDAIGPEEADGVASLVGFLQTAALGPELRTAVDDADLSLEDLRAATAAAAGIEVPELQKVWRVTWGSIARLGLLAFVAYVLISQLADIGWDTIVDAVASADDWILAVALAFGQVPRVATAKSLQTASPTPVPLARLARLEFAITFVNLAVPSTAARVAVNIRFFQRSGATAGGAISASALDSVFGFIAQISLLGTCLLLGLGTLSLPPLASGSGDRSDLVPLLLGLLAVVLVAAAVVWFVPKVRAAAAHLLGQLREALTILRSPSAVARLFLYNVLAQVLFSIAIWIVLEAFGQQVAITDVIIINVAVALFAGLMPVPGGVGVTEGALTAGFVAVGVPQATALAAALCYRLITFYLPPLWGYVALRSLRRDGYL